MKKIYTFILILLLAGCAMPQKQVTSVVAQSSLAFVGAPKDSMLSIDGLYIHSLHLYDGKRQVLSVEPGTHKIIVKDKNGNVLYAETIFLGNFLKTIHLNKK